MLEYLFSFSFRAQGLIWRYECFKENRHTWFDFDKQYVQLSPFFFHSHLSMTALTERTRGAPPIHRWGGGGILHGWGPHPSISVHTRLVEENRQVGVKNARVGWGQKHGERGQGGLLRGMK